MILVDSIERELLVRREIDFFFFFFLRMKRDGIDEREKPVFYII